jgi:glucose/mannose-6-phosphate isomerase
MNYDKSNMISVLEDFPKQLKVAVELADKRKAEGKFSNVVVCGMGGSGIGGELVKPFVHSIPVFSHHDYGLPSFVNRNSLVFIVSYSGNTEETLSAYHEAKKRRCKVIVITSGGKLAKLEKNSIIVPKGLQPRAALGYLFIPILVVLANSGIIALQDRAIAEAINAINIEYDKKKAHVLAKFIHNRIPVFYASGTFAAVAYRMKTQINECSKQPAFFHVLPEMNHNEINGFKMLGKELAVVFVKDDKDSEHITKRIEATRKLIHNRTNVIELTVKGKSLLARMLKMIYVGDLAAYYLALLNKTDPTPVPVIEKLKKILK